MKSSYPLLTYRKGLLLKRKLPSRRIPRLYVARSIRSSQPMTTIYRRADYDDGLFSALCLRRMCTTTAMMRPRMWSTWWLCWDAELHPAFSCKKVDLLWLACLLTYLLSPAYSRLRREDLTMRWWTSSSFENSVSTGRREFSSPREPRAGWRQLSDQMLQMRQWKTKVMTMMLNSSSLSLLLLLVAIMVMFSSAMSDDAYYRNLDEQLSVKVSRRLQFK